MAPAPQQGVHRPVHRPQVQLRTFQPRAGEETKRTTALPAAVAACDRVHLPGPTAEAMQVLAKSNAPDGFTDLGG